MRTELHLQPYIIPFTDRTVIRKSSLYLNFPRRLRKAGVKCCRAGLLGFNSEKNERDCDISHSRMNQNIPSWSPRNNEMARYFSSFVLRGENRSSQGCKKIVGSEATFIFING